MKIVFHQQYHKVYAGDPAAVSGRLKPIEQALRPVYEFVDSTPADEDDIALVHDRGHIEYVRGYSKVFPLALLAAGGAIQAADSAVSGEEAFALVRPPGLHASPGSCWGFCYFNNIAIAVAKLLSTGKISSALILDIDLHFGDGTHNYFAGRSEAQYLHPEGDFNGAWLEDCEAALQKAAPADIIAVSAGFDRHADDWGELLLTEDYETVGRLVSAWSTKHCPERKPFVVLEGGYNHQSMAEAAVALCKGLTV